MELKGSDRRALRGLGHGLKAVVTIGKDGVSPAVLEAIEAAHEGAELIKVKVLETCPLDRHEAADRVQALSSSEVVQVLGRMLLLYRRHPEHPVIALPSDPQRREK
jgi:RNA-binding protein